MAVFAEFEPTRIQWCLVIIGLVVLAVALSFEIIRAQIARTRRVDDLWRDFEEVAIERGLSAAELNVCREMAGETVPERPLRLLTSKDVFDECAGRRMTGLRSSGATNEELESASDALGDIRKRLGLTFVPFGRRLHSTRGLQPEQKLTIEPKKGPSGTRFVAAVLDVTDLGILISPPESGAGQVTLEPGQEVAVAFWRGDDARYTFRTKVHESLHSPKLAAVLGHADKLERTQARTFYRVRVSIPTTVAELASKDPEELERASDVRSLPSSRKIAGTISSLSGGGVSMVLKSRVNVDDLLRVDINLARAYADIEETAPDDVAGAESLAAACRVVSVSALPGPRYLVRASFALINETERDKIVRFVNIKEQKLAKEDLDEG
jgi:hypothetical protein